MPKFIDRWASAHSHHPPERNPKVIAMLIVLGSYVLPTAIGVQPLPGSLASVNGADNMFGQFASGAVTVGCALNVLGLLWPGKTIRSTYGDVTVRSRDTGIAVELAGAMILGVGLVLYSAALWSYADPANRAFAFGLSSGLGIGCFLRAAQIGLYIRGRALNSARGQAHIAAKVSEGHG